jgi:hypothetical protein
METSNGRRHETEFENDLYRNKREREREERERERERERDVHGSERVNAHNPVTILIRVTRIYMYMYIRVNNGR